MASDCIWGPKSIPASQAFTSTTGQFRFMTINSDGELEFPSAGGLAIAVLQDTPTSETEPGQCCRPGDISKVFIAEAINAGDYITTDGNGKAVVATSGDQILGQSLDTNSTVNSIIRFVYQPMGRL